MKKLIVDQAVFLGIGIAIMILIPTFCGPIFTVFFQIIVALCWSYLCQRILFLPLDVILGKKSQTVYYSAPHSIDSLEFFKRTNYYVLKFYFEKDKTLKLLLPTPIETAETVLPPKDMKIRITYYRFSKILLEWEQSTGDGLREP